MNSVPVSKSFDPDKIREDFPILAERFVASGENGDDNLLAYLDNAATTQKPNLVIEAIVNYYRHENANVHRAVHKLADRATRAYESARRKVANFIGASNIREIVFTRSTTEAINLVASAWGRKFLTIGSRVLLSEMEHHSNLIPWQIIAAEKGAKLDFIPFDKNGVLELDRLDALIGKNTSLVALTHMSNVFGSINPVERIIAKAHDREIPVLLDAAQSVPHMPVDVQKLDCDFMAFSGHKMCAPTGIGILYAKEKWLEQMDPYHGGGEMISSVWLDHAKWNDLPYKFEAGTPNIAGAIGLGAAIDYLEALGMENIAAYERELTEYALLKLHEVKELEIVGQASQRGGVISFCLKNIHPHDIAQFLDYDGIAIRAGHHCAQPIMRKLKIPATARASFYFYNTHDEVERLLASLQKTRDFFC